MVHVEVLQIARVKAARGGVRLLAAHYYAAKHLHLRRQPMVMSVSRHLLNMTTGVHTASAGLFRTHNSLLLATHT